MPPVAQLDEVSTASFSVTDFPKRSLVSPRSTKVSFKEDAFQFYEVDCFCEDEDLAEAIWYTKSEYDIIKARNALLTKMKKAGKFQESEEHTFRGLEHKIRATFRARRESKFDGLNAVLEEQERQYARHKPNPVLIAEAYMKVTIKSREIAASVGAIDAAIAQGKTLEEVAGPTCRKQAKLQLGDEGSKAGMADDEITIYSEASQSKKKGLRRIFRPRQSASRRRASM